MFLLVETWHDPDSVCISQLRNLNYNVIECSRPRRCDQNPLSCNHGGLVAFSHSRIVLSAITLDIQQSTFEFVCFRVSCFSSSCIVVLVYRTGPISSGFFDEFSRLLDQVITLSDSIFLAGDFNIHVERPDDVNARNFVSLLRCYGLSGHVDRPTHNLGGHLDLLFTLNDFMPPRLSFHESGLSDHSLLRWNSVLPRPALKYSTISYRPWKKLNMSIFESALSCSLLCDESFWLCSNVDDWLCCLILS